MSGADYNHDGRVGMDEAFAYSLIHDTSIDVPVCTSDIYLRQVKGGQQVVLGVAQKESEDPAAGCSMGK